MICSMQMWEEYLDTLLKFGVWLLIPIIIIALLLYFLPSFVATNKHKKQSLAIFFLNLFAGWTGIGWLIALIWAALYEKIDETSNWSPRKIDFDTVVTEPDKEQLRIRKNVSLEKQIIEDNTAQNIPNTDEIHKTKTKPEKKRSIMSILNKKLW